MTRCYLIIVLFLSSLRFSHGQELKIGAVIDTDPSSIATEGERYRFRADFNYDGVADIAISGDRREFGKMGGSFEIYLGSGSRKWRYVGSITAHPLALHCKRRRGHEGILTVYLRSSGTAGGLIRYSVSERGVKELSSKEIHPGDGGTDAGRAEYAMYFDDAIRLQPELSETVDGKISWSRYDR
jgi:hypothetical protein